MENKSKLIEEALKALSKEGLNTSTHLFQQWYTVRHVARRAGVSETATRNWLEHLSGYRGFAKRRFGRSFGYRYNED